MIQDPRGMKVTESDLFIVGIIAIIYLQEMYISMCEMKTEGSSLLMICIPLYVLARCTVKIIGDILAVHTER